MDACTEDTQEDFSEVHEARKKYQICIDGQFDILRYKSLPPILQSGPQCGLIAIAMCLRQTPSNSVTEIFTEASATGMTKNGEMFNAYDLATLARKFVPCEKVDVFEGNIATELPMSFLETGGIILVPYDADGNHSPCLKNGHKAHWAVLTGLVRCDGEILVIARHGKSKHLAFWKIEDLAASNAQLTEFSPDRKNSNLEYVVPEGGLGGPTGLKNKCVFIHNLF